MPERMPCHSTAPSPQPALHPVATWADQPRRLGLEPTPAFGPLSAFSRLRWAGAAAVGTFGGVQPAEDLEDFQHNVSPTDHHPV